MIFLLYFIILKVKGKKCFGIVRHFDPGELGTRGQGHFGQEDARDITAGKERERDRERDGEIRESERQ